MNKLFRFPVVYAVQLLKAISNVDRLCAKVSRRPGSSYLGFNVLSDTEVPWNGPHSIHEDARARLLKCQTSQTFLRKLRPFVQLGYHIAKNQFIAATYGSGMGEHQETAEAVTHH